MGSTKTKSVRYGTVRTPKGIVGFGYLTKPDMKFGAKHRIQLFIDPTDPEVKDFAKILTEAKAKHMTLVKKTNDKAVPGLKKADEYLAGKFADRGVKVGSLYFEFDSHARLIDGTTDQYIPVDVYDSANTKREDLKVWGGDLVRCSVTISSYESGANHGVKPYLNAVQILKSNGGGNRNVFSDESSAFAGEVLTTEAIDSTPPFETQEDAGTTQPAPAKGAASTTKAGQSVTTDSLKLEDQTSVTSPSEQSGGVNLADLI